MQVAECCCYKREHKALQEPIIRDPLNQQTLSRTTNKAPCKVDNTGYITSVTLK